MNVFIFVLTYTPGLILEENMQIIVVVADLLSLKLLIFRLIITYFGTLRMHQISQFLSFFFWGIPWNPLA